MELINDQTRKKGLIELEDHILNKRSELNVDGLLVIYLTLKFV